MSPDPASLMCWCGSDKAAQDCCAPVLAERSAAVTAVALMRARYSAYVIQNETFLLASWAPETRPTSVSFAAQQRWLGVKIRDLHMGAIDDTAGQVEFVARYKIAGRGFRLAERSEFRRDETGWLYVRGEQLPK